MRTIAICLALAGSLGGRCAETNVLRSARALDDFLQSGLYEVRPFALRGRVRQSTSPKRNGFFLDDGTNIVRLVDKALWPHILLRDGDIVEVAGRTVLLRNHGINPDCLTIVRLGHRPLPEPPERSIRDILQDRGQPLRAVRVRGIVRDVIPDEIDPAFASIVLTDDNDSLYLTFHASDMLWPELKALVGAKITADGLIRTDEHFVAGPHSPRQGNRELQEPTLTIPGLEAIQVVTPAPQDPFAVSSLTELVPTWPDDLTTVSRRRIDGIVLSAARMHGFLLRTGNGQFVNVNLADGPAPRAGVSVTAAGIPVTDLHRINLSRAIWKPCAHTFDRSSAEPEDLTIEDLLTDGAGHTQYQIKLHGHRIRLSGLVRSLPAPGSESPKVTIESNGLTLSLVAEPGVTPFADVVLDAKVEATGICLMDVESWRPGMIFPQVTDVRIAVQSPDDLRILSRPSWWTPRRLVILICVFVLALLVIVLWNLMLRTLVIRRSRALLREQAKRLEETLRVDERTRLATELHDTIAQNLSGLALQLDAAGRLSDSDPAAMKSILAFTSKALLACRRDLRDCLWDLRSQALDEADMNAAVRRTLTPHLGRAQLVVRFNVPRRKIADHTAHAVLRILGELAGNAIRHGKATTIRIAGSLDDEGLKFSCIDNGCGFDVAHAPGSAMGHFGLQGVRDRIRTFNGTFQLTSTPGNGTRAVALLRHPSN